MDTIEVPIDLRAIIQVIVTEQIKVVAADSFGASDDFVNLLGELLREKQAKGWNCFGRKKEARIP